MFTILCGILTLSYANVSNVSKVSNVSEVYTLENSNLRAEFLKENGKISRCVLYAARNGEYQRVGDISPLSELHIEGLDERIRIEPESIIKLEAENEQMTQAFKASVLINDITHGNRWDVQMRFSLAPNTKRIRFEYSLSPVRDGAIRLFSGPTLRAGEGAFEAKKDFALFPGLEFLEGEEASSSQRDAKPPLHLRLVPHPFKVTIPLMAVEHDRYLIGVIWDQLQKWDGEHTTVCAEFSSPNDHNAHQNQKNHLMKLFLPSIPDWMTENSEVAQKPYPIRADKPIKLEGEVIVDASASILDSIFHWYEAYGIPQPEAPPRSDFEEMELSRYAFLHTVWDESTQKSRHCVDWAPHNSPGFATLLFHDYLTTGNQNAKKRADLIVQNTIRDSGETGLSSTANCHILKWELPFYYGGLESALASLKPQINSIISSQGEDGGWRFQPANEKQAALGKAGDAVIGSCANNALILLKYARVSGDEKALEAGLKALKFMDQFKVPRGAQVWECPLYEPDILAAALAVGAYEEAYSITSDKNYLDKAIYWAKSGLPFLFAWSSPDRHGMKFGSIPVFGTTFFTHPWFGVPVQWNGLVYAYYLQHLARHVDDFPWRQMAKGITISAMHQQWKEGKLKGTYPDGYYNFCTEGKGPHINPEDIMVNLLALRNEDPDISTHVIHLDGRRIHISSGARVKSGFGIRNSGLSNDEISFSLDYPDNLTSYTLISGISKPSYVEAHGSAPLSEVEDLNSSDVGWKYDSAQKLLYLKLGHSSKIVDVTIKTGK